MNTSRIPFLIAALSAGLATQDLLGQPFDSGSNGSYGAINVTSADQVLDLPADGILHCTTIHVGSGRVLSFRPNALNTPVYLLATGDVTIVGTISVDGARGSAVAGGLGGPGGFPGGNPGSVGAAPGDGRGPGGGKAGERNTNPDGAGAGSFATAVTAGGSTRNGPIYGSPLMLPLIGGSGGGGTTGTPGNGGGGGGGALLIASNTGIEVSGIVNARGASYLPGAFNVGSGGAIRLVAPRVTGRGTLDAQAGAGQVSGGFGRIRIDALDRSQIQLNFLPNSTASIGSMMVVFPSPLPRLDIVEAAGTAIPDNSGPVLVNLPFGAPAAQVVRIRARDFGQTVPIRVMLTPDHGPARFYDAEIANGAANPAVAEINVEFPINTQTAVDVWTR